MKEIFSKKNNISEIIIHELESFLNRKVHTISYDRIGGGCINDCYRIDAGNNDYFFLKLNSADRFPGLFEKEKTGLEFIGQQNVIGVPRCICTGIADSFQYLVLEFIDSGYRSPEFWQKFGKSLARLHKIVKNNCGFFESNYIGSLKQHNNYTPAWTTFFIEQRIMPQVKLARDSKLITAKHLEAFEQLYINLGSIFTPSPASLLHGDLWSGNYMCNKNLDAILIDPAVYFGNRIMDLGMTRLFGGFDPQFYKSYHEIYPLPDNFIEQCDVANLYPLLIHLNLFGSSYLSQIETVIMPHA